MKKIMLVVLFCMLFFNIGFAEKYTESVAIPSEYHGVWISLEKSEDAGKTWVEVPPNAFQRVLITSIITPVGRHSIDKVLYVKKGIAVFFINTNRFHYWELGERPDIVLLQSFSTVDGKETIRWICKIER